MEERRGEGHTHCDDVDGIFNGKLLPPSLPSSVLSQEWEASEGNSTKNEKCPLTQYCMISVLS